MAIAYRPKRNCIQPRRRSPAAIAILTATANNSAPCSKRTIASRTKPTPIERYHQPQCFDSNPRTCPLSTSDGLPRHFR